jgi:hypothetical protein
MNLRKRFGQKREDAKPKGCKVTVRLLPVAGREIETLVYRNVTKIDYNYNSKLNPNLPRRTVFESSIHGATISYDTKWIVGFETEPEVRIAKAFRQR